MISRALALVVIAVFALVLGVALLDAVRARQEPAPVASVPTASATATALAAPVGKTDQPVPNVVACGTLAANSITSGQGSGPNTFELLSPAGASLGRFGWPGSGQSALGTYLCVRLIPGAPMSGFDSLVRPGEAGYVAQPPLTWASACGTVSDFVGNTASADGSLLLNSPGRSPLKITLTSAHSTPGGRFGGYICTGLDPGSPYPIFGGLWAPITAGFVPEGTMPATKAEPAPAGFVVPQSCAYVVPPLVGAGQTDWRVDCGAAANRDARGRLAPALTQQGWTSCGSGLGTAAWAKGTLEIGVSEWSGAAGDYPKFVQRTRTSTCP